MVLLDTNILLAPFQGGPDLLAALADAVGAARPVVPEPVMAELRALARSRREARAALRLIELWFSQGRVTTLAGPSTEGGDRGSVDEALADLAASHGALIATNDRGLIRLAASRGVGVLRLSGFRRFVLVGGGDRP